MRNVDHNTCFTRRLILFFSIVVFSLNDSMGNNLNRVSYSGSAEIMTCIDPITLLPDISCMSLLAFQSNQQLDSVYIDLTHEYNTTKQKIVLSYDSEDYFSIEKRYYGASYQNVYPRTQKWNYLYNGSILRYELIDLISYSNQKDTLTKKTIDYQYIGTLLQQKNVDTYSYRMNGNELRTTVNNLRYYYEYNDQDLLIREYYKRKADHLPDSSIIEDIYAYNKDLRIKYIESINHERDSKGVIAYTYSSEGSVETEVHNTFPIYYDLNYSIDTLSFWAIQERFVTGHYRNGLDSIYEYHFFNARSPLFYEDFRICYFYDDQERLSEAHYFKWKKTLEGGEWYILGKTYYTYDSDGKLQIFQKDYYDANYKEWRLQERHTYFYSSVTTTSKPDSKLNDEFTIYPNPASDQLYVKLDTKSPVMYIVYDLYGRQVLAGRLAGQSIDVPELAKGTYLLKITNSDGNFIKRLVKM